MSQYRNQAVRDFAARITAFGFRVYVAGLGEGQYGIIADDTGSRVLSFSFNDGGSLGGNYGPPTRESGTGWRMEDGPDSLQTPDDVRRALEELPPAWCGHGWRKLTTLAEHMATYGSSSRYTLFEP